MTTRNTVLTLTSVLALHLYALGGIAATADRSPSAAEPATSRSGPASGHVLQWDTLQQEYTSRPGESEARFRFWFTNQTGAEVVIRGARTACQCTVAKLPRQPWIVAPGESGPIEATMNLAGKIGTITKAIYVDTSLGSETLLAITHVTPAPVALGVGASMSDAERVRNLQASLSDRQVVFTKTECMGCHATPAHGKTDGGELYAAVCANCHDSSHRAAMVPDLWIERKMRTEDEWKAWIRHGRAGSMMPAFAASEGGPLQETQVDELARYLDRRSRGLEKVRVVPDSGSRRP